MERAQTVFVNAPDMGIVSGAPAHLIPDRACVSASNMVFGKGVARGSWGAVRVGSNLGEPVLCLTEYKKSDGTSFWIAVTGSRVWKKSTTDVDWVDITGPNLLSGTLQYFASAAVYRDTLIITNGVDRPRKWDGISSSVSFLGGNPPIGKRVVVFQNHIVFANTTTDPRRVQWSDIGNMEVWDAGEAGAVSFMDRGEGVVEVAPVRDSLIVYTTDGAFLMYYSGFPFTFQTQLVASDVSPVSSRSVAVSSDVHFFPGVDGDVYTVSQSGVSRVGQSIRSEMFEAINRTYMNRSFAFAFEREKSVCFALPTGGSSLPDRVFVLNAPEEKWGDIRRDSLTAATSVDVDDVTSESWDGSQLTWDTATQPWDSYSSVGRKVILLGTSSGDVFKLDPDTGTWGGSQVQSEVLYKEFDLGAPEKYKRLVRVYVLSDRYDGSQISLYVRSRDWLGALQTEYGPYTITMDGVQPYVDLDISARSFQLRIVGTGTTRISAFGFSYYMREEA